jgi:iron(III) transport system ATP-binding protein
MSELTVRNVTKSYGGTTVLAGVDLHVPAGSLTAILGASGCGKTTLLRLIAGFDRPDAGTIGLDGTTVVGDGRWVAPERRNIGYVAQEGALFPHLSVAANITFGLPRRARTEEKAAQLLALVGLAPGLTRRHPHQLSGGQQQRVALARALAPQPRIVLLDEPFSSLDAALREETRRAVVEALTAAGSTAVLVTHDQAEALSMANQVAVMRAGQLVQTASPTDLYRRPVDTDVATFVGEATVLRATVRGGTAHCRLGALPTEPAAPDGPADVVIRPEQLVLADGDGIEAQVTGVSFYGAESAARLQLLPAGGAAGDLADGAAGDLADGMVTARLTGAALPGVGDRVRLAVRGTVPAYPRPGAAPFPVPPSGVLTR